MRHLHTGRKLGVDHSHRRALIRSLSLALLERDQIKTTSARAKELRRFADRLVTLAKDGSLASRRLVYQFLGSTETNTPGENRVKLAVRRLYDSIAPRFKTRNGGYTQILHLGAPRAGDCAPMCLMRYLPEEEKATKEKGAKKKAAPKKDKEVKAKKAAKEE